MPLSDTWFLVTSRDIREIRGHLERISESECGSCHEDVRAIELLLAGIEQRLA